MMRKTKKSTIEVQGVSITILSGDAGDYLSLTDMAANFGDDNNAVLYNWMRNRNTLEFLGAWEQMHNPNFKGVEYQTFKNESGRNSFSMTPRKWITATDAIGIESRAGRYNGGTFAHKDIAFEFGSWLSAEFKLYLIKEFQRLKDEELENANLDWDLHRSLTKLNYRLHTDAIKTHLIPQLVTATQKNLAYSSEADLLNMALFGKTAQQWRDANPDSKGNIRDGATVEQLLTLTNLEAMNAEFIRMQLTTGERLQRLNEIAISQLKTFTASSRAKALPQGKAAKAKDSA